MAYKIKIWLKAFRLRTLPLALSSIIVGIFLSAYEGELNILVSSLAILTTIFLQILSNLANDFGDSKSGVDNLLRTGPVRTVQSGEISVAEMKKAIWISSIISFISGIILIYLGTRGIPFYNLFLFLMLGVLSIAAALKYTLGKNPYGYHGFGDLFVLIFFGLLGVMGSFFLNTHFINNELILPATAMGFLSVAVLNLNNMRDHENDAICNKKTLVTIIGFKNAKIYHLFLIIGAHLLATTFILLNYQSIFQFIFILSLPLFIVDLIQIIKCNQADKLDPFLKKQALKTLLFAFLFGIGLLL